MGGPHFLVSLAVPRPIRLLRTERFEWEVLTFCSPWRRLPSRTERFEWEVLTFWSTRRRLPSRTERFEWEVLTFFPNSDSELKGSNRGSKDRSQNPPQGRPGKMHTPTRLPIRYGRFWPPLSHFRALSPESNPELATPITLSSRLQIYITKFAQTT